jgi:glycine dehydrogenase subunit 1
MPYIPHTENDIKEMLQIIGVHSIDDLFEDIPENLKFKRELNIPHRLSEHALLGKLQALSEQNTDLSRVTCFLGAGIYDKFIPATVGAVISRGEYLTAYTPYQPEASQGYLQTIYEFQSMIAELYGMDLANASMYDGATSMAEAAIMATGVKNRTRVACARAVHPHYRKVLSTYTWSMDIDVDEIHDSNGSTADYSKLTEEHACLIVQYPNFYGIIEDLVEAKAAADRVGAMLIVVADPTACAILPPPGEFGADIVVGEGQPLGIPMGYGGPLLGLFACKQEYVRLIPGRIVGRTTDAQGRTGFTMTLRTREQDIRREKATSNICTNEALMALASTVYMSALGKNGMIQVAESTVRNTQYAMQQLTQTGAKLRFEGPVFGEFVLELPKSAESVRDGLLQRGILAGLPLGSYDPTLENCLLVAVTEIRTKAQIDDLANKLRAELSN